MTSLARLMIAGLLAMGVLAPESGATQTRSGARACYAAQVVEMSGFTGRGDVTVRSPAGVRPETRRPVLLRQCLGAGERVRVDARAPAEIVIRFRGGSKTLTAADPDFIIPGARSPSIWDQVGAIVSVMFDSTPPEAAPVETYGRRDLLVVAHPLLPEIEQLLPADQSTITAVWEGGRARSVELRNAAGRVSDSRLLPNVMAVTLNRGRLSGLGSLNIDDQLAYPLRLVDRASVPEPIWMEGRVSTTDDERVARAAWLLTDGSPEWRLFAVSELMPLQNTSFGAERIWEWVQLGGERPR